MRLHSLKAWQFRNLKNFAFTPGTGINLIYGQNASGKSSLLEAIYFLGTGKSFRVSQTKCLIQEGEDKFTLFGQLVSDAGKSINAGFQLEGNASVIKVNGDFVHKASSLARLIPIQIIDPSQHQIINEGPEFRRRFIEWGLFHVEPRYEDIWKQYCRNLAQRNAALKSKIPERQIREWDRGLAQSALEIDRMRKSYTDQFFEIAAQNTEVDDLLSECLFDYYKGWPRDLNYTDCLAAHLKSDMERGFTQMGPHRADLRIHIGKQNAKNVLSRGRQKLLISSLLVTQCQIIKQQLGKDVILLVDDLVSELDQDGQKRFINLVAETQIQAFITATEREVLQKACGDLPYCMFHVEHGYIRQVI